MSQENRQTNGLQTPQECCIGFSTASFNFKAMLCESQLWSIMFCRDPDRLDPSQSVTEPHERNITAGSQTAAAPLCSTLQASTSQLSKKGYSILPRVPQNQRPSSVNAQIQPRASRPAQPLPSHRPHPSRHISPEMEIPGQGRPDGEVPFLVPSSCQSICQNYSDLHIGGDQVLPLSAQNGELLLCSDTQADGPFLYSCDVPSALEEPPPDPASEDVCLCPLRGRTGSSRHRAGSGRVRSFLLQGREGPLSNSLLNQYLEHKLLDLYQQYMLERMSQEGGGTDPLLGSELIMTSLDQITLQLSREGHLEVGRAKDVVLSCFLRVASDLQSRSETDFEQLH
ncbi:hypothetical protein UPYG_G00306840 [Umbra pygmaea]|uniref:Uncharacterized protein n=1 Tax=Umbra pygmaea TaxID=75934 RepID=A0ABD0W3G0_UMBPY